MTVEPIERSAIKRGDILLYKSERGMIAHRVVRIREGNAEAARVFILRGDASATCDDPVAASQILGRVVSVERDGRKIDLTSRKVQLLYAARVRASQLRVKVLGMHDPQSKIKDAQQV